MLSVILPTRNRADLLTSALQSLAAQTLPQDAFEILVIDNGSTDHTKQVVASAGQRLPHLRYFYEPTPGLHRGRHLGMKRAKHDILVYADDDIEAFPGWLEAIAEAFRDPEVALVGGKNLPKFESQPPDWIMKMWEGDHHGHRMLVYLSLLDLGDETREISPYHVFGCNFSIRRSVLIEAGGFHPDAFPLERIQYRGDGESHVARYLSEQRYKTLYHPQASVYHAVPAQRLTEGYFCQRAYHQGISDSYTQIRSLHFGHRRPGGWLRRYYHALRRSLPGKGFRARMRQIWTRGSLDRKDETSSIQLKIRKSYDAGWQYHQKIVKRDPSLLGYVLQDNYMNELE